MVHTMSDFETEKRLNITKMAADEDLRTLSQDWFLASCRHRYTYNFSWLGRPIIQYPQDILAMHEIIWQVKPTVIVETGIAHGGSLIFYSSMLQLLGNDGIVVGVDIDIREHNRRAIEAHPMGSRIQLLEGSATDPEIVEGVKKLVGSMAPVLVSLDSNHTHDHVLRELELYAPLVSEGSYIVVFDTVVEQMPKDEFFPDRPWGPGNSPMTAVRAFLGSNDTFIIDREIEEKLLVTVAPSGFLRRVSA